VETLLACATEASKIPNITKNFFISNPFCICGCSIEDSKYVRLVYAGTLSGFKHIIIAKNHEPDPKEN
jgi:hypothetical protein